MNPTARMAAIILAAGKSARMGASKPLLPLGSASVIEWVISSVSRAGVSDILTVTGHNPDEIAPVLDRLGVRHVHNADYETGMFSSVQAGARALGNDSDAFFILPVDCPLVKPEVLKHLIRSYQEARGGILYPSCCGLRGHPPLISSRYRDALLLANGRDNLRGFLERHVDDAVDVDVEDPTILMDMDTPEEYQRIRRFAEIIYAADRTPGLRHASPTSEDALYLLSLLEVPEHVIRHSQCVTMVGVALAEATQSLMPSLDVDLVRAACMLHDMARTQHKHAAVAQNILNSLGMRRLASIVGSHMLLPREILESPLLTEEELVYLADKLVMEDKVVSLDERAAHALQEHSQDAAALEGVRTRMRTAQIISQKLESILGKAVTDCSFRD